MGAGKRQVVVAVDAGAPAQEAFRWALANLLREGDHVALVNVRPRTGGPVCPSAADHTASTGTEGDQDEGYLTAMGDIMDGMAHQLHHKFLIPCDRVIESGDPKKVICHEVTIRDAAALVMGTRGLDPVHRSEAWISSS